MKKSGFKLLFSDDTQIEVVPNDAGDCSFSIDETEISISGGKVDLSSSISGFLALVGVEVTEIEFDDNHSTSEQIEEEETNGIRRRCIICNRRRWCAKNGCIRTPCGWLCG